jgi:predicted Zn-dependent peptidase
LQAPAESLKKLTSKDLADFHAMYYRPNNAILAIVGDVTMKEIHAEAREGVRRLAEGRRTVSNHSPQAPAQSESRIFLIDRPGSVQTVLQLGTLGIERTSPDYFSVLVANRVLGGGPTGRLFMNLREDKGYTYGAYSHFGGTKFRGTWISNSEVRTDVTEGAMKEFMYELNRIRTDVVPSEELENAKRAIIGGFASSLEQPQTLLQNIITQKLYNLPADYWDTYPQKVSAITAADVQNAAKKYLDMSHLQVWLQSETLRRRVRSLGSMESSAVRR